MKVSRCHNQDGRTIFALVIIADTNVYDVLLGMVFLGPLFAYFDPLTSELVWRVDCYNVETMPTRTARLSATCRTDSARERRHIFTSGLVEHADDLRDAILGDESPENKVGTTIALGSQACAKLSNPVVQSFSAFTTFQSSHPYTIHSGVQRRHEGAARLDAALRKKIPELSPRTNWIGDDYYGASPISTCARRLDAKSIDTGLHVVDLFAGFSCDGLRSTLDARYKVRCHTSVEIDDISRIIPRKTLDSLQKEYPSQLPDSAIRGDNKRLPQNINLVGEYELTNLIRNHGQVDFLCGGWECSP